MDACVRPTAAVSDPWDAQDKKYDHKSDMWSLGCVLYELCSLRHPFEGRNIRDLVGKIMRGAYRPLPTAYRCAQRSAAPTACVAISLRQRDARAATGCGASSPRCCA